MSAKKSESRAVGRPITVGDINPEQFEALLKLQCSLAECAGVLLCSKPTVVAFCHRQYGMSFKEVRALHTGYSRAEIRRWQFEAAANGNTAMQIWLGKQYLGQSDGGQKPVDDDEDENQQPTVTHHTELVGFEGKSEEEIAAAMASHFDRPVAVVDDEPEPV
jgi:hypothetical protein